ncbi:MAG: WbqC family protein [Bacteroidales bacterium]|nr:WbqC family protein [Bacteroidales bacterium]
MSALILSSAYLPPVSYFVKLNNSDNIIIDVFEHFIKQSYRNRCYILTASGRIPLVIPVKKAKAAKICVKDLLIYNDINWQKIHWRTIETAYNSSPFFLYFKNEMEVFYKKKIKYLLDFNTELLNYLLSNLDIKKNIEFSCSYIENSNNSEDYRFDTNSKKNIDFNFKAYYQVFAEKFEFIPNLSIIDLIFNLGTDAKTYIHDCI